MYKSIVPQSLIEEAERWLENALSRLNRNDDEQEKIEKHLQEVSEEGRKIQDEVDGLISFLKEVDSERLSDILKEAEYEEDEDIELASQDFLRGIDTTPQD